MLTALLGNRSGAQRLGTFYLAAAASAVLILVSQWRRLKEHTSSRPDLLWLVMPAVFLIGVFGTVAAAPAGIGLFLAVLASYIFYYYHRHFPSPIPLYLEQTFVLYGAFLLSVFLWSLNFYFTPPGWVISLVILAGFFPLFWQAFYKMKHSAGDAALDGLVAALLLVEMSWVMLYWPVHFFTTAVVSFTAFYLVYMLSVQYFKGRLNKRKIYFQVSLACFVLLITLATSSWQPIK